MKSEEDREFDEKSLIKQVASGDHKAFTILYMRYLHGLYRYIYLFTKSKETTEEIIQNVFVKIWERRDLLTGVNAFKPYLYRSAKNMLIDEIRRNQVEAKVLFLVKPDTEQSNETSDAQIIYTQYYQIAQNAIDMLPEKRKQIVELRTKEDLTLDEIAEKLAISKSVVKKQLYTGMSFIKKHLHEYGELTEILILLLALIHL